MKIGDCYNKINYCPIYNNLVFFVVYLIYNSKVITKIGIYELEEKDEDKNIIRDEIIRCKPDPAKTKGIKFGNYNKLNNDGFIPENQLVENRDVIIAKTIPIKENRNDPTKIIKYEDQSKTFRTTEETPLGI